MIPQNVLQLPQQLRKLRTLGVDRLQFLHRLLELFVFFNVVVDRLIAVRQILLHGRIDKHLLGNRVPYQLTDHGVGKIAAFFGIGGDLDLLQQVQDFVVIGRQYVNDILINRRIGHVRS
jgi:hypothetical protein